MTDTPSTPGPRPANVRTPYTRRRASGRGATTAEARDLRPRLGGSVRRRDMKRSARARAPVAGLAARLTAVVSEGRRMRYDRTHVELAEYLNGRLSGWLVMWSPYRRTFTAVAPCTHLPLIIDDANPERLLDQARDVQREILAAARDLAVPSYFRRPPVKLDPSDGRR